jgi:hypothetical protein
VGSARSVNTRSKRGAHRREVAGVHAIGCAQGWVGWLVGPGDGPMDLSSRVREMLALTEGI